MEKGKWVVFWDLGLTSKRVYRDPMEIAKVTDKLVKFNSKSWPRQCAKADVIAVFESHADGAKAIEASIATRAKFAEEIKAAEEFLQDRRRRAVEAMIEEIKSSGTVPPAA